jgi:hypothetical protein
MRVQHTCRLKAQEDYFCCSNFGGKANTAHVAVDRHCHLKGLTFVIAENILYSFDHRAEDREQTREMPKASATSSRTRRSYWHPCRSLPSLLVPIEIFIRENFTKKSIALRTFSGRPHFSRRTFIATNPPR